MKVTCKTLQGAAFQVDCEPADKVASLKQKIQAANPSLLAEHAVTVFQGKVLQDASSLEEAGVSEKGFVVVMVKKPAAGAWALRSASRQRRAGRPPAANSRLARWLAPACTHARARSARGGPAPPRRPDPGCTNPRLGSCVH